MISGNSTQTNKQQQTTVVSRASRRYHNTPDGTCGDVWYKKQEPMLRALQAHVDGDSSGAARPFAVAWGFKDRPGYMYGFYNDIDEFYSNLQPVPANERRGYGLILAG